MEVNKAREIKNCKIQFVSLVDRAANLKSFLITKRADKETEFTTNGAILKADDITHTVTGVCVC